jgi:cation diffusion facilitator family transporter
MAESNRFNVIPDYGDTNDPVIRAKYGYLEATISIIGNAIIFIIKLALGLFINSIALIADAFHTLSDVGTSGVVIFGFKLSKKPSDKEHPFGHGRVEYIATLIIAVLLVITGLGFIQQSIDRIINAITIVNQEFALIIGIIIIITAIIKELMARFSFSIGRKINSDVLIADAWHHRSDVFASIAVGISIVASNFGFPLLDPIFGIIISGIIIYVGITLVRLSSDFLIGQAPDRQIVERISNLAKSTAGVKGIHDIFLHDYGTNKVITLHAEVNNNLTIEEAHNIANNLEDKIKDFTKNSTIIHIEPKDIHTEIKAKKSRVENILKEKKEIISFHKIQIIRGKGIEEIKMHLIVDQDMSVKETNELHHRLESSFKKEFKNCSVDIHFDPCCGNCVKCTLSCQNRLV